MAMKAKHAFGMLENIDSAMSSGAIDSYDILFVKDANGKPYVGWVDKEGKKVVVNDDAEFAALETELAKKANAEEVEAKIAEKANAADVEAELATKADAEEVETKIGKAVTDTVASANAYTDKMVEAAMGEHLTKKYEVSDVPEGTIVDMRDKEIRVMCKADAVFTKQSVGAGGDANSYYMTFKVYAPNDAAVGYIEHLNGKTDEEILTDFKTDTYGRRYQPTWLTLAKYDEATDVWNYYGKNSTVNRYIGWDYRIDWYNADGVMIASDSVRINLSNENCHSVIEPYYVGSMKTEIETMVEEKIAEADSAYEIIEF